MFLKNNLPKRIHRNIKTNISLAIASFSRTWLDLGYYRINNFGDLLNPYIFKHFGFRIFHVPKMEKASVIGLGSLLHMVPDSYQGSILGTGLIDDREIIFDSSKIFLLRGYLTVRNLGLNQGVPVGDPGLLIDEVFDLHSTSDILWDVGIVPHYMDQSLPNLNSLINRENNLRIKLIDVRKSPRTVIEQISACKFILSSSLHGLITADSLGLPNAWMKLSDRLIGGRFKFDDYYSCFDEKREPVIVEGDENLEDIIDNCKVIPKEKIQFVKDNIFSAFSKFKAEVMGK